MLIRVQVCPIQDDEDGHLSYKLGDIIENENQRCKWQIKSEILHQVFSNVARTRNTSMQGYVNTIFWQKKNTLRF